MSRKRRAKTEKSTPIRLYPENFEIKKSDKKPGLEKNRRTFALFKLAFSAKQIILARL